MKATLGRLRAPSTSTNSSRHLSSIPPPKTSTDYSPNLAALAARILYRSPLNSRDDLPLYILDASAFPDSKQTDYDSLLPYVLARLPAEDELLGGTGYEVVFFAGWSSAENTRKRSTSATGSSAASSSNGVDCTTSSGAKKSRPGWGWFLQAYQALSRAMRKRLMKLYVVHEKGWIRILMEMFATVVSPKVRKKVIHVSSLSALALQIPIEDLLIPPSAYMMDRQKVPDIFAPYATGRRAFGVRLPLPVASDGQIRLPRILRETTNFILIDPLIKMEGIFRVSARAQTVEVLQEAFERAQKFIVWREESTVLTFPHFKEGSGIVSIQELEPLDGYDAHTAAALIKLWYHDLREPVVPPSSYRALEKFHSGLEPHTLEQLHQMLSPGTEAFSPLPQTSRQILTIHLLPLLSRIADYSDWNRMAPSNLATVFAPNLICGPDPVADLKMIGLISRLLTAMITEWKQLARLLGCADEAFEELLRLPEAFVDREDPLQEFRPNSEIGPSPDQVNGITKQATGISLEDNDRGSDVSTDDDDFLEGINDAPPLPPRRPSANTSTEDLSGNPIRRKPAPAVVSLPRYSTVFGPQPTLAGSNPFHPQAVPQSPQDADAADLAMHGVDHDTSTTTHDLEHGHDREHEHLPTYESVAPSRTGHSTLGLDTSAGVSAGTVHGSFDTSDSPQTIHRKPVSGGEKDGEKGGEKRFA